MDIKNGKITAGESDYVEVKDLSNIAQNWTWLYEALDTIFEKVISPRHNLPRLRRIWNNKLNSKFGYTAITPGIPGD